MEISFRPLNESHFPLLLKWLETPHVKKWWDSDIDWTMELIQNKYLEYTKGRKLEYGTYKKICAYIIYLKDRPTGYIQAYNPYEYQGFSRLKNLPSNLVALDFYIADPYLIYSDLGTKFLSLFFEDVLHSYPNFFVSCAINNTSAIRCLEKTGFQKISDQPYVSEIWMFKTIRGHMIDLYKKEDVIIRNFLPRLTDPIRVLNIFKYRPIKVLNGFCDVCDQKIENSWFIGGTEILFELKHLVQFGILRIDELEILIRSVESQRYKYYWIEKSWLYSKVSAFLDYISIDKILNYDTKTSIKDFWLFLQNIFRNRRKSSGKNRWYLSKKQNLYNPLFEATIYAWDQNYNIARLGFHHKGFESIAIASERSCIMWIEDNLKKSINPKI